MNGQALFVLSAAAVVPLLAGRGTGSVVGTIRNESTGEPLAGVHVHTGGGAGITVQTDRHGRYQLSEVPSGVQKVDALLGFRFPEHRMLRIHSDGTDTLNFQLRADPECCDRETGP